MPTATFDFKQFTIHQDRCAMKVGTDGVLLGAWAGIGVTGFEEFERFEKKEDSMRVEGFEMHDGFKEFEELKILDIGAGTGLISLILAQRFPSAQITAVEIDSEAASQCLENFEASPWADRLTVIPHSLADYELALDGTHQEHTFDLIVTNPPFYNATLKPEDKVRAIARHKDSLPADEIASFAHRHLSADGQLALIYPIAYDSEVMMACTLHGLMPTRLCDVLTKEGKPCKRRMAAFRRTGTAQNIIKEKLTILDQQGQYTRGYRQLVDSLYLHLS